MAITAPAPGHAPPPALPSHCSPLFSPMDITGGCSHRHPSHALPSAAFPLHPSRLHSKKSRRLVHSGRQPCTAASKSSEPAPHPRRAPPALRLRAPSRGRICVAGGFHVVDGFAKSTTAAPATPGTPTMVHSSLLERSSAEVFNCQRGVWEVILGMWQLGVPPNQIVAVAGRLSFDCVVKEWGDGTYESTPPCPPVRPSLLPTGASCACSLMLPQSPMCHAAPQMSILWFPSVKDSRIRRRTARD